MLTRILETFVFPSAKKLSLIPAAFAASVFYGWLCWFAESLPIPTVAEPSRSATYWTIYSALYFFNLFLVIGLVSREPPDWYLIPAWIAFRGVVYRCAGE